MLSSIQTMAYFKSQEFNGYIKKPTLKQKCQQWHSGFGEMLYQNLGTPRLSIHQDAIWQTTTFNYTFGLNITGYYLYHETYCKTLI